MGPIFWFLHFFTHHSAFRMTQIMTRHRWRDFYKDVKAIYQQCLTCQVHNPGKTSLASDILPLGRLNTCSLISLSCRLAWVIDMFLLPGVFSG